MKIKSTIIRNANAAINNCREVLVRETIELIKQADRHDQRLCGFNSALFLHERSKNGMLRTIVLEGITGWDVASAGNLYYTVRDVNDYHITSEELSLVSLQEVFLTVKRIVERY